MPIIDRQSPEYQDLFMQNVEVLRKRPGRDNVEKDAHQMTQLQLIQKLNQELIDDPTPLPNPMPTPAPSPVDQAVVAGREAHDQLKDLPAKIQTEAGQSTTEKTGHKTTHSENMLAKRPIYDRAVGMIEGYPEPDKDDLNEDGSIYFQDDATRGTHGLGSRYEMETGIADLEQSLIDLQKRGQNANLNISPLLAYIDSEFGSNIMKGYKPPMSADEYGRAEALLKSEIAKQNYGQYGRDLQQLDILLGQGKTTDVQSTGRTDQGGITVSPNIYTPAMPKPGAAKSKGKGPDEVELAYKLTRHPDSLKLNGIINFNDQLKTYVDLVNKYGVTARGAEADALDTAYSDLKTSFKEAKKLGALSGPDMGILLEALKPVTGLVNAGLDAIGWSGGVEGINSSAGVMRGNASREYDLSFSNVQKNFGGFGRTDSLLNDWNSRASAVGLRPGGKKIPQGGSTQSVTPPRGTTSGAHKKNRLKAFIKKKGGK